MEVREGSTLGSFIPHHPHGCSVELFARQRRAGKDRYSCLSTTAGEVAIEMLEERGFSLNLLKLCKTHSSLDDRYASAFGPFPSPFTRA